MQPDSASGREISLPLFFVLPGESGSFPSQARVLFKPLASPEVQLGKFLFTGTILRKGGLKEPAPTFLQSVSGYSVPYFSIVAVILIILFRNLYFNAFRKYFLSALNNYEIDFSLQKIGVPPVIMAFLIVFLVLLDFVQLTGLSSGPLSFIRTAEIIFYPMAISAACLFFLSLSLRFFPLIFPDLKVLFLLSILLLAFNFALFSLQGIGMEGLKFLPLGLSLLFFALRSLLFFMVLRKFYRYRSALSLFYICALNLSTSLVFYKVLG
jgi:hypothetical protein